MGSRNQNDTTGAETLEGGADLRPNKLDPIATPAAAPPMCPYCLHAGHAVMCPTLIKGLNFVARGSVAPPFPSDRCENCFDAVTGMGVLCAVCESQTCSYCGCLACACPSEEEECDFCEQPTGTLGKCLPCESAVRAEVGGNEGELRGQDLDEERSVTEQRITNLKEHASWLRDISIAFDLNKRQSSAITTALQLCNERILQLTARDQAERLYESMKGFVPSGSVAVDTVRARKQLERLHESFPTPAWDLVSLSDEMDKILGEAPLSPSGYSQILADLKAESRSVSFEGPEKKAPAQAKT